MCFFIIILIFCFLNFFFFRATLAAYGSSQAGAYAPATAMLGLSHGATTYTTAHGSAGSLTH